jgi:hypothetical protein
MLMLAPFFSGQFAIDEALTVADEWIFYRPCPKAPATHFDADILADLNPNGQPCERDGYA